jgi:rod shape determining protein RodA
MGVSLIFVCILIGMAFAGGVNMLWFLGGTGALVALAPIIWGRLGAYQQNRILILFDPTIDPTGIGPRYHTRLSLESLTGGGLTGQGLFQGTRTQTPDALPAQHTDFIFSAIGEELGYAGCAVVLILLFLIIARCFQVGMRSQDYMRRLVCFGAASALIFQVVVNVGMCIGVMPVIGITLPFVSYGGSSIVTLYAMLGLVSGVHERPAPASHERYIRAPYLRR